MKKLSIKNPLSKKGFSLKKVYNSIENYLLNWDLKKVAKNLSILAVLVALVGGYLWYSRLYMTSERRFWLALDNSMSTASVTRTIKNGGTGNEVIQDQQFFFSPQQATRSHVSFVQKTSTIDTAVETEGVSFVGAQYSRYTAFRTNQTKDDGTLPSLSSVIGKWEGTQVGPEELENAKLNYLSENITLAIFGNYNSNFRNQILTELKNNGVYTIETSGIREDVIDGKNVLQYPLSMKLREYTTILQKAFIEAGYGEFPALDPSNYDADSKIVAEFTVDKKNNSLIGIKFGSREEIYRGYGINIKVDAPKTDYSGGELEEIVQKEIEAAL